MQKEIEYERMSERASERKKGIQPMHLGLVGEVCIVVCIACGDVHARMCLLQLCMCLHSAHHTNALPLCIGIWTFFSHIVCLFVALFMKHFLMYWAISRIVIVMVHHVIFSV